MFSHIGILSDPAGAAVRFVAGSHTQQSTPTVILAILVLSIPLFATVNAYIGCRSVARRNFNWKRSSRKARTAG